MTTNFFTYDKGKVIQALRFHFITRKEIKVMMIMVNVFAILSATLFYMKKVSPLAFLVSSVLWFAMMIAFWYLLPTTIYKKSSTFKEKLRVGVNEQNFTIENERGHQSIPWTSFTSRMESPYFFYVYFDARTFFIIPKEEFKEEEISEVRKLLSEKIKLSAKKVIFP